MYPRQKNRAVTSTRYGYSLVKEPVPKSGTEYLLVSVNYNYRGMQTDRIMLSGPPPYRSALCHREVERSGDQSTLKSRSHRDAPQQQDENHIYRNGCSLVNINMPIKIRLHPSRSTRNHKNMNILYLYEHISSCKSLYFCSQS